MNSDLVLFVRDNGRYGAVTAGSRLRQGQKHVEIVAFAHEKTIQVMTVCDEELGPIIPFRSVLEVIETSELVNYSAFMARQRQLLKQYEVGESEREKEDRLKQLEAELQETKSDLSKTKTENATLRGREKALKLASEKSQKNAEDMEHLNTAEKEKVVELKKKMKKLEDETKESRAEAERLRQENDSLRRQLNSKRFDVESRAGEYEQTNKRQKVISDDTSESGRNVVDVGSLLKTGSDLRVKSFKFGGFEASF